MATAKRVPVEPVEQNVQLTLTPEEARTLLKVCHQIGGSRTGPRGYIDNIARALLEVGIVELSVETRGYTTF